MREYYGVGQPTGVDKHGMQAAYKSLFGDPFNKDAVVGPDGTYIPSLYFGQQVESLMRELRKVRLVPATATFAVLWPSGGSCAAAQLQTYYSLSLHICKYD